MSGSLIIRRMTRLYLIPLLVGLPALSGPAAAIEANLADLYVEASTGNVQYKTPDDFLFTADSYNNPQGAQLLLGLPFKRQDDNLVSLETFFSYLGAAEDERIANNILSEASLETTAVGLGMRLGKKVGQSAYLSTRLGVHYWTAEINSRSVSMLNGASLSNMNTDEDGYHVYGGLNLAYFFSEHLFLSGGGQVLTLDLEGKDVYITHIYLGIGARL